MIHAMITGTDIPNHYSIMQITMMKIKRQMKCIVCLINIWIQEEREEEKKS